MRANRAANRATNRAANRAAAAIASVMLAVAVAVVCAVALGASDQAAKPAKQAKQDKQAAADPTKRAIAGPAEAAEIAKLPEGPTKQLVAERCLLCHSAGLITQQHKDSAAWGRTVTQMRTWGTPIQDDDQAAIVAYLAEHFGPAAAKR